jgi:hypothetical protein
MLGVSLIFVCEFVKIGRGRKSGRDLQEVQDGFPLGQVIFSKSYQVQLSPFCTSATYPLSVHLVLHRQKLIREYTHRPKAVV